MSKQIYFATVDAETDPFDGETIPEPFIWGFYDGYNYEKFDTTLDLIQYLFDKDIIVYAHNGGKFDWHFLLDYLEPDQEILIINGRISRFKIGECEFRDSYNIIPTALSAFKKDDIDYDIMKKENRNKAHNKKKIELYLYADCVYLHNYIYKFIERFGLNLSLAGTAMKQWQIIADRKAPRDMGGHIYNAFKKYYYGGRCQAFYHGIVDFDSEMVDIKSAYPYAMTFKHPISLEYQYYDESKWYDDNLENAGQGFITLKAPSTGALPFRGDDKALYFPDDNKIRQFDVTGWELRAAIETGTLHKREIEWVKAYKFCESVDFKIYIEKFYADKLDAENSEDKAGYIFAKLLMNALYGKFGSNPDEYKEYKTGDVGILSALQNCDGEQWEPGGMLGPWLLLEKELEFSRKRFYNVATAASITGFVRAFLQRALSQSHFPLYCDTDSIIAKKVGNLPNGLGKNLGQWEKEAAFKSGAIAGRKMYAMEYAPEYRYRRDGEIITHKIASKGVRVGYKDIYKVAKGGEIIYKPLAPSFSVHSAPRFVSRTIKMVKKVLE